MERLETVGGGGNQGDEGRGGGLQWASRGWRKVNCLLRHLGVKLSFALGEDEGGGGLDGNSGWGEGSWKRERRWDRVKVRYLGIV